jgi:hypothetical protein
MAALSLIVWTLASDMARRSLVGDLGAPQVGHCTLHHDRDRR